MCIYTSRRMLVVLTIFIYSLPIHSRTRYGSTAILFLSSVGHPRPLQYYAVYCTRVDTESADKSRTRPSLVYLLSHSMPCNPVSFRLFVVSSPSSQSRFRP